MTCRVFEAVLPCDARRQEMTSRGGRNVPTPMLWGRVCEHFYISPEDLSAMLARLGAQK
jgi:hypothetical protein